MKGKNLNTMIKVSLLSVISLILMMVDFSFPVFFPQFLKMDISDFPALIGGFALGPVVGVLVCFFKNLLHLILRSSTAGVGELANFLISASLVLTSSFIYWKKKDLKGAIFGLIAGIGLMSATGCILNVYVLLPMYETVFKFPIKAIIDVTSKVNPYVHDLKSFVLFAILPFNILKGVFVSLVTVGSYKSLSPIIKGSYKSSVVLKK